MRGMVFAEPVFGGDGYIVTLDCGHKLATREQCTAYHCRTCDGPPPPRDPISILRDIVARCPAGRTVHVQSDDVAALLAAYDAVEMARCAAAHSAEQWEESHDIERARADTAEHRLRNLLALIHRDGGHYEAAHGMAKACNDAEALVVARLGAVDEINALVAAVRAERAAVEPMRAADAACDDAREDALRRGVADLYGDAGVVAASKQWCTTTGAADAARDAIDAILARHP